MFKLIPTRFRSIVRSNGFFHFNASSGRPATLSRKESTRFAVRFALTFVDTGIFRNTRQCSMLLAIWRESCNESHISLMGDHIADEICAARSTCSDRTKNVPRLRVYF